MMQILLVVATMAMPAWAADTVRIRFEGATPAAVVAWAAEATGRDGYIARGTAGEVDVSTGDVSAEAALHAAVSALEAAGLRVTVTQVALVARDPALSATAPLVAVHRAPASGIPTDDCPGVTSRAALGRLDGPLRVFASPVQSSADAPGLRLSGIPRGGPVAALGLRSADVLEAIEGSVVWTPDDGMTQLKAALMAVLKSDRPATFRVRRRGEPIVWSCHVKKRSDESGARRP